MAGHNNNNNSELLFERKNRRDNKINTHRPDRVGRERWGLHESTPPKKMWRLHCDVNGGRSHLPFFPVTRKRGGKLVLAHSSQNTRHLYLKLYIMLTRRQRDPLDNQQHNTRNVFMKQNKRKSFFLFSFLKYQAIKTGGESAYRLNGLLRQKK